jgi:hypothetical protein
LVERGERKPIVGTLNLLVDTLEVDVRRLLGGNSGDLSAR